MAFDEEMYLMRHTHSVLLISAALVVVWTGTWARGAFDVPIPSGSTSIIQAENCTIVPVSGNYSTGTIDGNNVVYVATDASGDKTRSYGDIKFKFPSAIPDGEYTLRVRWKSGTMNSSAWAFMLGSEHGDVTEGGYFKNQWHYFYPGHLLLEDNGWFTDDLAGPNGLRFKTWPNSKVLNYITVSGVGAGDFYVRLWDTAVSANNYFAVDSFELTPVTIQNRTYHFDANNCTITSSVALRQPDGVLVAYDYSNPVPGNGHQNATGEATFAFPAAIANGDYVVKMAYELLSWTSGTQSSFAIVGLNGATVTEHGVSNNGAWRAYWPTVTNIGHLVYEMDELAGPNGMQWPHQQQADYITVSDAGANGLAVKIWDQSGSSYNCLVLRYFELLPTGGF